MNWSLWKRAIFALLVSSVSHAQNGGTPFPETKEVAIKDFFDARMENQRLYKVVGSRCEILLENEAFVFYGSEKKQPVYKVNKTLLQEAFPGYRTLEGFEVREKASQATHSDKIPSGGYGVDYAISLESAGIQVICTYEWKASFFQKTVLRYQVLLNKTDLSLMSVRPL